jgi:hypothetical protein
LLPPLAFEAGHLTVNVDMQRLYLAVVFVSVTALVFVSLVALERVIAG